MQITELDPSKFQTRNECEAAMFELDGTIAAIEAQIGEAKHNAHENGQYTKGNWFWRAHTALKHARRLRVATQNRLGEILREIRRKNHEENRELDQAKERLFIKVAKEKLTGEMYAAIWDEVCKRVENG